MSTNNEQSPDRLPARIHAVSALVTAVAALLAATTGLVAALKGWGPF
ncbi:hypothetical protein Ais01nite_33430 [Asanoa ishikariensis]|uniref:Uncharacterized protein n=2 Tax=Asanoa ishikariensis TaxID=137265 RepID=A0A1H3L879_9ACTN|nr:hypothetical protein [Asanoa ishikariensis]GIF65308.1 hypothetical protein Ais01nite_33430 [Asanoa ishikariensis]SDY60399.1 hypothetical protein SAMN05421684_0588 [Asanoa ishikariensis]